MVGYQEYEVNFSVLTESRNGNFMGSGPSSMQWLTEVVTAPGIGQAREMVEARYGGRNNCIVHAVVPLW